MCRRKIKERIKEKEDIEEIDRLRNILRKEMRKWRAAQRIVMPSIAAYLDNPDLMLQDVEREPLYLPSSFTAEEREDLVLGDLAAIELRLREGEAADAVVKLQSAIGRIHLLEKDRGRRKGAVSKHTRAQSQLNNVHTVKRRLMTTYREARKAMISLGMSSASKEFPELTDKDTYRVRTLEPHEFTSGSKLTGWVCLFGRENMDKTKLDEWDKEGEFMACSRCTRTDFYNKKRRESYGSDL